MASPSLHLTYLNNNIQEEEKDDNETTAENNLVHFESTKSATRLASLAERCILARLVTSIHLHRGKTDLAVDFMFRYLLSTAPALELEEYPKYPPVQSMCILEAILTTQYNPSAQTLLDYIQKTVFVEKVFDPSGMASWLSKSFHSSLSACAGIYRVRSSHEDSRISEIALVEVAAYQRVIQGFHFGAGMQNSHSRASDLVSNFLELMETYESSPTPSRGPSTLAWNWVLPLVWTIQGDGIGLREVFMMTVNDLSAPSFSKKMLMILLACARAIRQLEVRSIDNYRKIVSSPLTTSMKTFSDSLGMSMVDSVLRSQDELGKTDVSMLSAILHELSDGESALNLLHKYPKQVDEDTTTGYMKSVGNFQMIPSVRVINLQRRQDRMAAFMSQAMQQGLWVMRGVVIPKYWLERTNHGPTLSSVLGTYAVDGSQASPAQVEQKLTELIQDNEGKHFKLDSLISPQWNPHVLKPFDSFALNDPNISVSLSPSEKACALSHISTWKGIAASLPENSTASVAISSPGAIFCVGFARGEPMSAPLPSSTAKLRPTPVFLVLEDDAILVDRFVDRLDKVLEELPRDFHFCSLGYAKPKEGPLVDVPGCQHIKLPTMTWYLTGYLLSFAGARYLLQHLPVVGPVDTWMGRRMIMGSNWENEYGNQVGVGNPPVVGHDTPKLTKKELRLSLQFRAYCATVPLCYQKVRTDSVTGAGTNPTEDIANHHTKQQGQHQHWRHRDTDIVYSGNVGSTSSSGRKPRQFSNNLLNTEKGR
jgi:GR25 family glycosyltransferase involved in LPS biosynthesis